MPLVGDVLDSARYLLVVVGFGLIILGYLYRNRVTEVTALLATVVVLAVAVAAIVVIESRME